MRKLTLDKMEATNRDRGLKIKCKLGNSIQTSIRTILRTMAKLKALLMTTNPRTKIKTKTENPYLPRLCQMELFILVNGSASRRTDMASKSGPTVQSTKVNGKTIKPMAMVS